MGSSQNLIVALRAIALRAIPHRSPYIIVLIIIIMIIMIIMIIIIIVIIVTIVTIVKIVIIVIIVIVVKIVIVIIIVVIIIITIIITIIIIIIMIMIMITLFGLTQARRLWGLLCRSCGAWRLDASLPDYHVAQAPSPETPNCQVVRFVRLIF